MKTSSVMFFIAGLLVLAVLAGCAPAVAPAQPADAPVAAAEPAAAKTFADLTVCFPQLGAESDWRTANTASMKETAAKLGIKQLVFSDAQQKQENQISAIRACIQQAVDVIALPPVVETGWDAVLTEAKSLGLRAVIIDADKGIRTVGSRKAVATASLYEVTGPEGKAFTVKKGEKYDSLIDLAKGEGLYEKYWAKHPPKDGKRPEEVSISYNKVISSFEGWKVLAK